MFSPRTRALALSAALLGCAHRAPVRWQAPAAPAPQATPIPSASQRLSRAFTRGVRLSPQQVSALFPELGLDPHLATHALLSSTRVGILPQGVVLHDPQVRFFDRRWGALEVGVCTQVLLHPSSALVVHREDMQVEPPVGAWIATDRTTLRRVGAVIMGIPKQAADASPPYLEDPPAPTSP